MAEFNLNTQINYPQSGYDPAKRYAAAQENMEKKDVKRAEEAIGGNIEFGLITLSNKLKDMGFGPHVREMLANIVLAPVNDVKDKIDEYWEKYEIVLHPEEYEQAMNSLLRKNFFNAQAMAKADASTGVGQKFVAYY